MPNPEGGYLAHYGTPGMKWGQRKSRSSGSGKAAKPAKSPKAPPKKPTAHLSDDELKSHISRLMLEKQYRDLTAKKPSLGKKFLTDVLTDSGKKLATEFIVKGAASGINKALAKAAVKSAATVVKAAV